MEKIGIIGSGTWGTAIAVLLRNNGHEVTLWSAIPAEIEEMANQRKELLMKQLMEQMEVTEELKESNQMEWIQRMNNIEETIHEIIIKELIYS